VTARRVRLAAPLLVIWAVVAACGSAQISPSSGTAAPAATSSPDPDAGASGLPIETPPGVTSLPLKGQTDTDWGRIWDRLPHTFPIYRGSTASDEAATGPASAVYVTSGADAADMAGWFQQALEQASYSTESLSGPMEDGGYVLDSTGTTAGCRLEVTISPLGDSDTISASILYGAACPLD
jgi:hypothetical protein